MLESTFASALRRVNIGMITISMLLDFVEVLEVTTPPRKGRINVVLSLQR